MSEESSSDRSAPRGVDPPASAAPASDSVLNYLIYTLSVPERAVRSSVGVLGGAVRESAGLLVPQAIRDSQTYAVMVRQTLDFLVEEVGGVERRATDPSSSRVDDYVARKTVGNFVELAGLATLHLSPLMVLAIASDVAHGSRSLLQDLAVELRREGVIDDNSTIDSTSDLLAALGETAAAASNAFDTPPLSLEGLQQTIAQTTAAAQRVDARQILPQAELQRLWTEMQELATAENVTLWEVSSAMTLHSLDKFADVGRGALSSARVAGNLIDRHVFEHYGNALSEIHRNGYYATLASVSEPYIEAVWHNFSVDRSTLTQDLLSGRVFSRAGSTIARWLGVAQAPPEEGSAGENCSSEEGASSGLSTDAPPTDR